MIQAQDLRIGNLVNSGKGIYKVISISHYKDSTNIITVSHDGVVIPYLCIYKPIPINEEWLVNLGFEKVIHDGIRNYYLGLFCIEKIDYLLLERKYGTIIKYVHQLQNLYFAITGKELTSSDVI